MKKTFDPIMVEEVYHGLLIGETHLFLIKTDGVVEGYLLLQEVNRRGVKCCHIRGCYNAGKHDLVPPTLRFVDDLVRNMGAQKASFSTSRLKWARRVAPHGYRLRYAEFVKDYT